MSTLLKLFTPSGARFYDLYEQVASTLVQMSALFSETIATPERVKRRVLLEKTERFEQRNDDTTHKLFVELGKNFITPFDREDIHFMASSLDDIADAIWTTSKQLYYFDIVVPGEATNSVAQSLEKFSGNLALAINGLRNSKALKELIHILKEMRQITAKNDNTISDAMSEMINNTQDHVELIKYSDHYNMLQNLNNKCSDVINVIEGVIIKYS